MLLTSRPCFLGPQPALASCLVSQGHKGPSQRLRWFSWGTGAGSLEELTQGFVCVQAEGGVDRVAHGDSTMPLDFSMAFFRAFHLIIK